MPANELAFHQPELCRCDVGDCTCPCSQCQAQRDRLAYLARMVALEDQLQDQGIYPGDLADLVLSHIWKKIEDQIEVEAERLARRHLERLLSDLQFKEKLGELLFDDMVEVAMGVQRGVRRNGTVKNGAGRTSGGG